MPVRARLIVFIMCLTMGAVSAQANWLVWLYQPHTGIIRQINQDGETLSTRKLPLSDGYTAYPESVSLSPDGTVGMYVLVNDGLAKRLLVTNLADGVVLSTFDLPKPLHGPFNRDDVLYIAPYSQAFDPNGLALAISYRIGGEGWAILILDVRTGAILYTLRDNDPALKSYAELHSGMLPVVQAFRNLTIYFTIANEVGQPFSTHRNFAWHLETHIIEPTIVFPTFETVGLSTGETVSPLPDHRFPMNFPNLRAPRLQTNSLHVFVPANGERFPFFNHETLNLREVIFIQNGERLLITAQVDPVSTVWLVVGRDGTAIRRLSRAGYDVVGTPDGFIYLTDLDEEKTALLYLDTRAMSAAQTVWVGDGSWQIAWVESITTTVTTQWAKLAESVIVPPIPMGVSPTPLPAPPPFLVVGMDAQVQTLENDYLNLRDAPTTKGQVLVLLESGTLIELVEGPVEAEGFIWWKVRVGQREGWAVESLGIVQSIIPRQPAFETTAEAG